MRFVFSSTAASALIAGAVVLGAVPAVAQNVDAGNPYFDHAEGTMSTNAGTATQSSGSSYLATHHQYMQIDPRDAKVDPNAATNVDQADASNPYFNHAEGTMSDPDAIAQAPRTGSSDGQYVARYHQYMQVDPSDLKPAPKADGDASQEMLYDHAMGTMSR